MDTDAKGQLGGMEAGEGVRRRLAGESRAWRCSGCGRGNEEVMREVEEACKGEEGREDEVPEQLKLGYREDLGKKEKEPEGAAGENSNGEAAAPAGAAVPIPIPAAPQPQPAVPATPAPTPTVQMQQRRPAVAPVEDVPVWIDKAIVGVVLAILAVVWLRFFG